MAPRGRKTWSDNLPATKLLEVTPSDVTLLPSWGRAVKIVADGNIEILAWDDEDGDEITFAVVAGELLPIRAKKIMMDTTADCVILGG